MCQNVNTVKGVWGVKPFLSDIYQDNGERVQVLSSAMGTGKTHLILQIVSHWYGSFKNVVIVSTRHSYGNKMRDHSTLWGAQSKIRVCQIDSLGGCEFDNPSSYFIVMDEFESILQRLQFLNDV